MTTRQWSIVAVLVFLNAFIFAILFMFLRQVYLTPPEVAVVTPTPTRTPTFTPLSTYTPTPILTPSPTNTRVVPTATTRPTSTPTFTPAPPTPTFTPVLPTPTSPPTATPVPPTPTNTPTFTPIPYEFMYQQGSMQMAPNCGTVYIEGMILDQAGAAMNGVTVRMQFFDNTAYRVSGVGQSQGIWGFAPLAMDMYHTPVTFYVQLVKSQSDPTPRSDVVTINFTKCDTAGQFTNITFRQQY